jgi:hypothetical protein
MKRFLQSVFLLIFATAWTCSQNGPTTPVVNLKWPPSATANVTNYCYYKSASTTFPASGGVCPAVGTVSGTNVICTAAQCSFTDPSPTSGETLTYWVSTQAGGLESAPSPPSNSVPIPVIPVAPGTPAAALVTASQAKTITPRPGPPQYSVQGGQPSALVATIGWKK